MAEDRFDAIIVGGGLAGLAAAHTLAAAGREALVLERGDYCGAKNVTGGRLYVSPIREALGDLLDGAPFERPITQEELCVMSGGSSLLARLCDPQIEAEPHQSYSVSRAKLDRHLARRAESRGAVVATKQKVERLIWAGGKVDGVEAGGEELRANVVICCDGVLSFTAREAGLRGPMPPGQFALGVKQVIELPAEAIESRFNLAPGAGVARLFMGDPTQGKFGGGFLYTNKESISLGLVVGLTALAEREPKTAPWELLERFKARPEVARLIDGGQAVEYSAHLIPEGGYDALSRLSGEGILVAGDAAGFSINAGITVRGMEYALMSGHLAARTAVAASERGDYGAASLGLYERLLRDSFVMADFKEHRKVARALDHDRFFAYYPELATSVLGALYRMPPGPKPRIFKTLAGALTLRDLARAAVRDLPKVVRL
ncbi:MAG: FAD-dependent oxidoreductase [Bifidobacteriaceae bacterium]|jgi:electron transfer flavoprotein-quinone oxidoreductase|nr:FAD-dependent oxidoreductase [Bifidobacteriaceae bacterium]